MESSAFRMHSSKGCRYHLELFLFLRRCKLAYSARLIWLATMEQNPEALDLMLRNKAFERLQGLYVKIVNGKPVIVNLSQDQKSKLQPQGLRMSVLFVFLDAYVNAPVTIMANANAQELCTPMISRCMESRASVPANVQNTQLHAHTGMWTVNGFGIHTSTSPVIWIFVVIHMYILR